MEGKSEKAEVRMKTSELTYVVDPRAAAAEARRAGKLVVWIPFVRSKEKLCGVLSTCLRFPDYFGGNWDALEECLNDLSWLPADAQIVIVHAQPPFGDGENRRTYFEILQSACNRRDGRTLEIVLPS